MMADTPDQRLGTAIAGNRIEARLGRAGMGVVYRAQHMNLRRRAAVKIIVPELADAKGFRTRFIREAPIAAALQHPNIVTVCRPVASSLSSCCAAIAGRASGERVRLTLVAPGGAKPREVMVALA
jgi:hypothetical protein